MFLCCNYARFQIKFSGHTEPSARRPFEDHMKDVLDLVFKREKTADMLKRHKTKIPSEKSTFKHPLQFTDLQHNEVRSEVELFVGLADKKPIFCI